MITYNHITLIALGILGVLLHCLVELNKINKSSTNVDLKIKTLQYVKTEIFSIVISLIVVLVCVIASQEIAQLQQVGQWLGLAFVAIGYMGQSLLIAAIGKAQKVVDQTTDNTTNNTNTGA